MHGARMARARHVHRVRCAAAVATRVPQLQRSRRDPQEHYNIYNRLHCVQSDYSLSVSVAKCLSVCQLSLSPTCHLSQVQYTHIQHSHTRMHPTHSDIPSAPTSRDKQKKVYPLQQ